MSRDKWISREEEANLPKFESHEEAKKYFEEKYGDDFIFSNIFKFEGENVHVYLYIIDRDLFLKSQKYMQEKRTVLFPVSDPETKGFSDSSQRIMIWENGRIQVSK